MMSAINQKQQSSVGKISFSGSRRFYPCCLLYCKEWKKVVLVELAGACVCKNGCTKPTADLISPQLV